MEGFYKIRFNREYSATLVDAVVNDVPQESDETWHEGDDEEVEVIDDHGEYVNVQFGEGSMLFGLKKEDFTIVKEG